MNYVFPIYFVFFFFYWKFLFFQSNDLFAAFIYHVLRLLHDELVLLSYLPTPPLGQDMTQGQFFKRSLTGWNSEYSFS